MHVDETSLANNSAVLMTYVRYWLGSILKEQILFACSFKTDTKGETMLKKWEDCCLVGKYRGYLAYLRHQQYNVRRVCHRRGI